MNKIEYLNKRIQTKDQYIYDGPKSLFKYRSFDEHAFDMLENKYLFLCPAEKLDDPTECMTTVDYGRLIELQTNNLKRECVDQIIQLIKPYTTPENYEIARSKVYMILNASGTVRPNFLLDIFPDLQALVPGVDIAPLVNCLRSIPEMLDKPEIRGQIEPLIALAYNARKEMGICSLSENNNNEYMWKNYADGSSGYCIEYDIENYEGNKDIFPVIYQDERETNILIQLVGSFVGQMITGLSNGQIDADKSHYIRLFLTKYKKWEYQNEWRLIGDANAKLTAPSISHIYLGRTTSENRRKMKEYALNNRIEVDAQS